MPKLEYDSNNEDKVQETIEPEIVKPIKKKKNDEDKEQVKERKPRSAKQIEVTNKMRDALKHRQLENQRIKELAKLEHEELKTKIKKKLHKNKVKEEVEKKIKEIVESSSEDESESTEEQIIIPQKKKRSKPIPIPNSKKYQYAYEQNKPTINFF